MMREIVVCDKCKTEIPEDKEGSKTEVYDITYNYKVSQIDLCTGCTREFVRWLDGKGEPIPKQTTT